MSTASIVEVKKQYITFIHEINLAV